MILVYENMENDIFAKNKEGVSPRKLAKNKGMVELLEQYHRNHGLLKHVVRGNVARIKVALDNGADVNLKTHEGDSVLHLAVKSKNAKVVETLLKHKKIKPNVKDADGNTPILLAAKAKFRPIINLFHHILQRRVGVNTKNAKGETALSLAANNEDLKTINVLLDLGAKVDMKDPGLLDKLGKVAVAATNAGDVKSADRLYNSGVDTPTNKADLVKFLKGYIDLHKGDEHADTLNRLLYAAASKGQNEIVTHCIKAGANVDSKKNGRTALFDAVSRGDGSVVEVLLENKATIDESIIRECERKLEADPQARNFKAVKRILLGAQTIRAKDTAKPLQEHGLFAGRKPKWKGGAEPALASKAKVSMKDEKGGELEQRTGPEHMHIEDKDAKSKEGPGTGGSKKYPLSRTPGRSH